MEIVVALEDEIGVLFTLHDGNRHQSGRYEVDVGHAFYGWDETA